MYVDLFDHAGKTHLICVNRWSSFLLCKRINSLSIQSVISVLLGWFNILEWPQSIRSDGGPQFSGPFTSWCSMNNINHQLLATCNPKSNGQAESAVKNVKYLLSKCIETGQYVECILYEWRECEQNRWIQSSTTTRPSKTVHQPARC